MRIEYDSNTDTAYIYFLDPEKKIQVWHSEEVEPGVVVDFDRDDRPIGIEIYDEAREKLAIDGVPLEEEAIERIRREERKSVLAEMERRYREAAEMLHSNVDAMFRRMQERAEPGEGPDIGIGPGIRPVRAADEREREK